MKAIADCNDQEVILLPHAKKPPSGSEPRILPCVWKRASNAWFVSGRGAGVITAELKSKFDRIWDVFWSRASPTPWRSASKSATDIGFSANQIRFIQTIVEQVTASSVMKIARRHASRFTDTAPQGPEVIATEEQVGGIAEILNDVLHGALPDVTVA